MDGALCLSCHKPIPMDAVVNARARGGEAKFCSTRCRNRHNSFAKRLREGQPSPTAPYQTSEEQQASVGSYQVKPGVAHKGNLAWYIDFEGRRYEVPQDFDPEIARGGECAILMEIARHRGDPKAEPVEAVAVKPELHLGNVLGAINAPLPPGATPPTREQLEGFIDGLRALQDEAGMRVPDNVFGEKPSPWEVAERERRGLAPVTSLDAYREAREDQSSSWDGVDMPW